MSSPAPVTGGIEERDSTSGLPLLPEQRFWKRYSPQHELPLSTAASITLHGLVIALLVVGGIAAVKFGMSDREKPLPISSLALADGLSGGSSSADDPARRGREVVLGDAPAPPKAPEAPKFPPVPTTPMEFEATKDNGRLIGKADSKGFRDISNKAFDQIRLSPTEPAAGHTSGGPPRGTGTLRQSRPERQRRWTLIFNTRGDDGSDYLTQLRALGAILAIPVEKGGYLVIRDLKRPETGKIESLEQFQEMYWRDTNPASVRRLARALSLSVVPPEIIAFFPKKLEDELLDKELKDFQGPEKDIKQTHFEVRRVKGRYEPIVKFQSRR